MEYAIGGMAAAVLAWLMLGRGASPRKLAANAADSGDLEPLVAAANKLPKPKRSKFFQQAIMFLWENYQRPLAVKLVRHFADQHSDEKICQYWLRQSLEVEPNEAKKVLDGPFLKRHYNPEVAAACGCTSK